METKSDEKLFNELKSEERNLYLQKARYLIEYDYVESIDIEKLAVQIYSKRRVKQS
jgi:hypothetical protein